MVTLDSLMDLDLMTVSVVLAEKIVAGDVLVEGGPNCGVRSAWLVMSVKTEPDANWVELEVRSVAEESELLRTIGRDTDDLMIVAR